MLYMLNMQKIMKFTLSSVESYISMIEANNKSEKKIIHLYIHTELKKRHKIVVSNVMKCKIGILCAL